MTSEKYANVITFSASHDLVCHVEYPLRANYEPHEVGRHHHEYIEYGPDGTNVAVP